VAHKSGLDKRQRQPANASDSGAGKHQDTGDCARVDQGQIVLLFLQATEKHDEFWAAVSDEKKNQTQIGRYSVKDFSFKPVMTVPQLIFASMSMWVDAEQKKVYVVYKSQLLRLPLPAAQIKLSPRVSTGVTKK
jgi:hypothetical protein